MFTALTDIGRYGASNGGVVSGQDAQGRGLHGGRHLYRLRLRRARRDGGRPR